MRKLCQKCNSKHHVCQHCHKEVCGAASSIVRLSHSEAACTFDPEEYLASQASNRSGGQRVVRALPQPSGRTERPPAPPKAGASYLDTEDARYEIGQIIRGGAVLTKSCREIADDVIAHLKKQAES